MMLPKPLPNDLIDSLLANYKKPEDFIGRMIFSSNSLKR